MTEKETPEKKRIDTRKILNLQFAAELNTWGRNYDDSVPIVDIVKDIEEGASPIHNYVSHLPDQPRRSLVEVLINCCRTQVGITAGDVRTRLEKELSRPEKFSVSSARFVKKILEKPKLTILH